MSRSEIPPERSRSRSISPLLRLWPYLRPRRWMLAAAGVSLVAAALLTLTFPVAFRRVIDHGFGNSDAALIDRYFLALLAVAGALALATSARFYLVSMIGERLVADLRRGLFDHLLGMSPAFFEAMRTGEVISRLTADMAVVQSAVDTTISVALRNILLLVGAATMMLVTSPKLAVLVAFLVPPVVAPLVLLGRRLRRLARESQDRIADASGIIGEVLQEIFVVQAFTAEANASAHGGEAVEQAYRVARRRITVRSRLTALVIFLVAGGVVGIAWVGATDVGAGRMSPGALGQFVFYAVFVGSAAGSLSEVWGTLQLASGAAERLFELLDARKSISAPAVSRMPHEPVRGEIVFQDVVFRYPMRSEVSALDGFSMRVRPGERLALVGPSGAGKSTVLQLLLRFYDPVAGRIEIDGVDIREMDPCSLRRLFAVVPQEPAVFARSAAANIALGRDGAQEVEIEAAARAAGAHGFLSDLPQGYDTWLGERGVMLSGGQNQRIAIARAILRAAPVLLLDEATSALDAESERAVQQAIDQLASGRTVLAIAHRLATVKRADRIVVLEAGRVVAEGTHDSLVAAGGLYARLARLQFTAGEED